MLAAEIEGRLHQLPYVAYAIVLGAGRRAPVALIAVAAQDRAGLIGEQIPAAKDCALHDSAAEITLQRKLLDDVAHVLFDLPAYKHPSGLMLVAAETLSIAGGELTSNLKIRRKAIEGRFARAIERLHIAIDQQEKQLPIVAIELSGPMP